MATPLRNKLPTSPTWEFGTQPASQKKKLRSKLTRYSRLMTWTSGRSCVLGRAIGLPTGLFFTRRSTRQSFRDTLMMSCLSCSTPTFGLVSLAQQSDSPSPRFGRLFTRSHEMTVNGGDSPHAESCSSSAFARCILRVARAASRRGRHDHARRPLGQQCQLRRVLAVWY